jgi:glycosyltransferase involved in cell wall biosynthesis
MPKVSVILTSYNHEKYIKEAINSVLGQTYEDFELVIWDDASSDDSWRMINSFKDDRIKAYQNSQNPSGTINRALKIVSGKYVAIHHSDDVWEPDKLEKQVAFLDAHHEIGAVFTNALAITNDGHALTDQKHLYFNIFDQPNRTRHEWLNFFFNHGNALCHPSVLIRKSCYDTVGAYEYGYAQLSDFNMWIRLCLKYEIFVLPDKLVRFRVLANEANSSGNRPETRIRGGTEFYRILRHYLKISSYEEMVLIFPEAARYYREEGFDAKFVLAMIALEKKPFPFTELFGIELLFDIVSDPVHAEKIKKIYGFDRRVFFTLTKKHDGLSLERLFSTNQLLAERERQISARDEQIAILERNYTEALKTIDEIHKGTSWLITAPIRHVSSKFNNSISVLKLWLSIVRHGGGVNSSVKKTWRVFAKKGWRSVKDRILFVGSNRSGIDGSKIRSDSSSASTKNDGR